MEVDHYVILGLPSGEEGSKLTENDIKKAYRLKALELHPDKNHDDPKAHDKFQNLKSSYEILKDEKARKLFDDLLRVKREQLQRQSQYNVKRRKMMSDLDERERASFAPDQTYRAREEEEERIVKKLQEEIARIRAMHAKGAKGAVTPTTTASASEARTAESANSGGEGLDKEKALKVSWEGDSEYYSAQRLREVFGEFGEIEDIVIHFRKKKKGSALVVMASKDAAVAAMSCVCGDLSNPLLVLPVSKKAPPPHFLAQTYEDPVDTKLNNLVGARYQAKEDSILEKLRKKAAENKK